jgi:hypothetical protein
MRKVRSLLKNMIEIFCFQCFFKCHYHLHPLVKSERDIVNQGVEEDHNLGVDEEDHNLGVDAR